MNKNAFVHLHVHTEYSLLDGAARVKELVNAAKDLGMEALAITDHGNMHGVIPFYKAAKDAGIKPVIGCEVYLSPTGRFLREEVGGVKYYHLILLAENKIGYQNLSKLVSLANMEGFYYKPRVDKELLRKYHEGIIALSACVIGEIPRAVLSRNFERAGELVEEYIEIFGKDNFFLELQNHGLEEERRVNAALVELSKKYGVKLVATNDVHYVRKDDADMQDALMCIGMNKTVDDKDRMRFSGGYYLKSAEEMAALFKDVPEAVFNTREIADRVNVEFEFGELKLPFYAVPKEYESDEAYLRALCSEKVKNRYEVVTEEVKNRLDYELSVIHRMGYDGYFLIVWDFVSFAKNSGIAVGPGRGSAAGSIVAYALGITDIDPLKYNLLFERFLNPERVSMPDIDIDFCYRRREEVIQYVKRRYGNDHVALIATFGTLGAKLAVRDVGRVFNMPYGDVDKVAKLFPNDPKATINSTLASNKELAGLYESYPNVKKLIDMAKRVEGMLRHTSTHAAGVVITKQPLFEYLPVSVSDGALVTQYDKDCVEELGLLKMDFLGLRTLTIMEDAADNIRRGRNIEIDMGKIPLEDEKTSKMLCAKSTLGVFQMESPGMTNLVAEIRPKGFKDLIPTVALYRPGPLGSGMVADFIKGSRGEKKIEYMHPLLEPILKETFGVVLYQEQVMQIVQVLAGFTLGEADLLRRAMGKKKAAILMAQRDKFLSGCEKNGLNLKLAEKIFDLLKSFADYGFNKSHSAAYALVAWQTAYLKAHFPEEFMAALMSSVQDSDKVAIYIEAAERMGIKILPPDINESYSGFTPSKKAIRFGLSAIKSVGDATVEHIVKIRRDGKFNSYEDFFNRVDMRIVNKRAAESFIKCGAFDSFGLRRSQMLATIDFVAERAAREQRDRALGQVGLFGSVTETEPFSYPDLPEIPIKEKLEWEKELTGFYMTGHPLMEFKDKLRYFKSIAEILGANLPEKKTVKIGGFVASSKHILTKKGEDMCFLTLEDATAQVDVTVFPRVFYENMALSQVDTPVVIQGKINRRDDKLLIIADKMWSLYDYNVEFYISLSRENSGKYGELQKILKEHKGNHQVYVDYGGKWRKLREDYWVDGSEEICEKIKNLLGENSLRVM